MILASIKLEAACDQETELRLVERIARTVSECLRLPIHDVIVVVDPSLAELAPEGSQTGPVPVQPPIEASNAEVAEATAKLLAN